MKIGDKVRVHQVNERYFGCEGIIVMQGVQNSSVQIPSWLVFFDWEKPQTLEMHERELDVIDG